MPAAPESAAVVRRYLDAMAAHDWDALAATLAPHVVRMGPYRDEYRGRNAYVAFLRATIESLSGYELTIGQVHDTGTSVVVELTETVDDRGGRLRTHEAVVFEFGASEACDTEITRVAVFLQTSEHTSERRP